MAAEHYSPPKDSTRWLLERASAILQTLMMGLMLWLGTSMIDLQRQNALIVYKLERAMEDARAAKIQIQDLREVVQELNHYSDKKRKVKVYE